jgi:hypothetical protein
MKKLKLLIETYTEISAQKQCQGTKNRLIELDESVEIVLAEYDDFPSYARLRGYMNAILKSKSNWGCNEVVSKLVYSIKKLYPEYEQEIDL